MPYDQHWNAGVQHELMKKIVMEVDYVGNKGSFLPEAKGDLRCFVPVLRPG